MKRSWFESFVIILNALGFGFAAFIGSLELGLHTLLAILIGIIFVFLVVYICEKYEIKV